jgi:hypothetical protein
VSLRGSSSSRAAITAGHSQETFERLEPVRQFQSVCGIGPADAAARRRWRLVLELLKLGDVELGVTMQSQAPEREVTEPATTDQHIVLDPRVVRPACDFL